MTSTSTTTTTTTITTRKLLTTSQKQKTSRLQISIPADLYRGNGYPHEEASFGIPKYPGTIAEV